MSSKWLSIDARRADDGTFDVLVFGKGYDASAVGGFIALLEDGSDDDTFVTAPVLKELEDPALIAELERRVEEVSKDPSLAIPWKDVRKNLRAKYQGDDRSRRTDLEESLRALHLAQAEIIRAARRMEEAGEEDPYLADLAVKAEGVYDTLDVLLAGVASAKKALEKAKEPA